MSGGDSDAKSGSEDQRWGALLEGLTSAPAVAGVAAFTPAGAVAFGSGCLADADVCARITPLPPLFAAIAATAADATAMSAAGGTHCDDATDSGNAIGDGSGGGGVGDTTATWGPLLVCGDKLTIVRSDNATVCATSQYKRSGCVCARIPYAFLVVFFRAPFRLHHVAPLVDATVRRLRM